MGMMGTMVFFLTLTALICWFPHPAYLQTIEEAMSLPSSASDEPMVCEDIFSLNGLNYTTFYLGAAHGLHSLSLEEIRYFFDENATEDNKIPTVNIDFRSEEVLHFNAPLWGYEDKFDTWSLKIMDWFMLNDQPHIYETVNIYRVFQHPVYQMQNAPILILMYLGIHHIAENWSPVPHAGVVWQNC